MVRNILPQRAVGCRYRRHPSSVGVYAAIMTVCSEGCCSEASVNSTPRKINTLERTYTHTHTSSLITVAPCPKAKATPSPIIYNPQFASSFSLTQNTQTQVSTLKTLYFGPWFNFPLRSVAIANPKKIHCWGYVISRMGCIIFIFSFSCSPCLPCPFLDSPHILLLCSVHIFFFQNIPPAFYSCTSFL